MVNKLGIRAKILGTVLIACVICAFAAMGTSIYCNKLEVHKGLVDKSRTIHSRLNVAAKYVANQGGLAPMIEKFTQKYKDSSELTEEEKIIILQQVPIFAAKKLAPRMRIKKITASASSQTSPAAKRIWRLRQRWRSLKSLRRILH